MYVETDGLVFILTNALRQLVAKTNEADALYKLITREAEAK